LATNLRHLKRLLEEVKEGADISIGSRYMGISAKRTFLRRAMSVVYNTFIRIYFGSKIRDHQCGFKAYKRDVIHRLIDKAGYDKKLIRGWFWDAEILIRAQKEGYKIAEFPVEWICGESSSFKFRREIKLLKYVIKLKSRLNKERS